MLYFSALEHASSRLGLSVSLDLILSAVRLGGSHIMFVYISEIGSPIFRINAAVPKSWKT